MQRHVESAFAAAAHLHVDSKLAEAVHGYRGVLRALPSHSGALNNLGAALITLSRFEEAAKTLNAAARASPSAVDSYLNLGIAHKSRGNHGEAASAYEAAVRVAPSASTYGRLGGALLSNSAASGGDDARDLLQRALGALAAATRLEPLDGTLWERRGDACLAAGEAAQARPAGGDARRAAERAHAEAAHSFERALGIGPTSIGSYTKLAMALHALGTAGRPALLSQLLGAMRQLQLDAPHATRLVGGDGDGGGGDVGGGSPREITYAARGDLPGKQPADCTVRALELAPPSPPPPPSPSPPPPPPSPSLIAAFATPLYVHALPADTAAPLNTALRDELLRRAATEPSLSRSNRGGWQSEANLLSAAELPPPLRELRERALEAVDGFVREATRRGAAPPTAVRASILNAWANVNRRGDVNLFHDHPQAILSGVYYVDGAGGALELVDPRYTLRTHAPPAQFEPPCDHLGSDDAQLRPGYLFEHAGTLQVPPTPGSFVLFPAWLMHRVRPHDGDGARVSVSFNVWLGCDDGGIECVRPLFRGA